MSSPECQVLFCDPANARFTPGQRRLGQATPGQRRGGRTLHSPQMHPDRVPQPPSLVRCPATLSGRSDDVNNGFEGVPGSTRRSSSVRHRPRLHSSYSPCSHGCVLNKNCLPGCQDGLGEDALISLARQGLTKVVTVTCRLDLTAPRVPISGAAAPCRKEETRAQRTSAQPSPPSCQCWFACGSCSAHPNPT